MIDLKRIGGLVLSFALALALLWFGHHGLERELAREVRSLWVLGFYGVAVILGLLVAPSVRGLIRPAIIEGIDLGRRAYDKRKSVELPKDAP